MHKTLSITCLLVYFSLFLLIVFPSNGSAQEKERPVVKSINSPDGDIIDCVMFELQPAFDLPELRDQMSWVPPELPEGHDNTNQEESEIQQLWNSNGESCPNGTIPIRRTDGGDIESISTSKLGRKFITKRFADNDTHEHAIGGVRNGEYYGAHAYLNVWKPLVIGNDFSLSQIWVYTRIPGHLVNTIEAGWHVYPRLYNDKKIFPRLFAFWTPDGYQSGCYNLMCPGFIQTSGRISLGAAIDPISTYTGKQFVVAFTIWKEQKTGRWWLKIRREIIGYWPEKLFNDLRDHATSIDYGGEVCFVNLGKHTSTQMGSGHFPDEGYGKTAYIRDLQVVDKNNVLKEVPNLKVIATKPNCYNVEKGYKDGMGNYIYFGGPGYNPNCP